VRLELESGQVVEDATEGSLQRHFRATSAPIRLDDVVSVLVKYRRGDPSWKIDFAWEKVDLC